MTCMRISILFICTFAGKRKNQMTNEEYIRLHREEDTSELALRRVPEGVDLKFCLEQIKSWQKAERKLPRWAGIEGIEFPPTLSMEQCSSEATALYKQELVRRVFPAAGRRMADLTGGFGVDFSYLAPLFRETVYVERQERLCDIARRNMPLLGLPRAGIYCADSVAFLLEMESADLIFMDPARRDEAGRKTVRLEDCTPCVTELLPLLKRKARFLLLKLSPMLDIRSALRDLPGVREVHVVSVEGECRELLLLLDWEEAAPVRFHCVDLGRKNSVFIVGHEVETPLIAAQPAEYLYEPNASVLKAGVQDALCGRFGVEKLHPNSNLFTAPRPIDGFPGRGFRVMACHDFTKQSLKTLQIAVKQANLTVRNFPDTVDRLRKRLKLKEGGAVYLFATTLSGERHALIQCEKW